MDAARAVPQGVKEGMKRFLSDFVSEGYTLESHGIYYQVFGLLNDARAIEEAGNRPCVRFYRDPTGRIDGLELAVLKPKKPTLEIVGDGHGAAIRKDASSGEPENSTPAPIPYCVRCEHFAVARNGFCVECSKEIEEDIGLDDVERPAPLPRPYYGTKVDRFGGSPE